METAPAHPPIPFTIRAMQIDDYARVRALWDATEGVSLNESDTREAIAAFLDRNPGLSVVAIAEDESIVGAVLCGHDGRRGYLHHLAVARVHRRQGIARAMVARCLEGLAAAAIPKVNLFLLPDNHDGRAFWKRLGWATPVWGVMQRRVSE